MKNLVTKKQRIKRSRKKLTNPSDRHIVRFYKSAMYDYLYVIDPKSGNSLFSLSTQKLDGKNRTEKAQKLGIEIAKKLTQSKISTIVFDRSGYKYHGRLKTATDAMRKNGINF